MATQDDISHEDGTRDDQDIEMTAADVLNKLEEVTTIA
jgi:hypothetical protein